MYPVLLSFKIPILDIPFALPTYGFFLATAFVLAIQLGHVWAMRKGYDPEVMGNFYVVLILSSIAGARAVFVWLKWPSYFADHMWESVLIWRGGLVFYGGVIGGVIGCLIYVFYHRLDPWAIGDLAAPCLALGHMVGRVGCLLNGCCFGGPTDLPWGMSFPATAYDKIPRHPTQLYEILGLAVIFLLLGRLFWRPHRAGAVAMTYVGLYACLRFTIEVFRGDDRGGAFAGGFSVSQWIAIGALLASLVGWTRILRRPVLNEEE